MIVFAPDWSPQEAALAEWAGERLATRFSAPLSAMAVLNRRGELTGAVIFNGYTGPSVEISVAGSGWAPGVFRAIAGYAFGTLGCVRIQARTRRSNRKVRRWLGRRFKFEGTARRYFGDEDALVFSLLADEAERFKARQR